MFKLQHTFLTSLLLQASSLKIMFKFLPIFAILGIATVLAVPLDPLNQVENVLNALPLDPLKQVENALKPNDNTQANSQENNSNNGSDKNHSNNDNSGSQDLFHVMDNLKHMHPEGLLERLTNDSALVVEGIKNQLHNDKVDEDALEIKNSIKYKVEDIIKNVINVLDKLDNEINNILKHVNEKTSEIVNHMRNVTEETVQKFINKTDQAVAQARHITTEILKKTLSELRKQAHNLLNNINRFIQDTIHEIENRIHSIFSNIKYIIRLPLEDAYIMKNLSILITDILENIGQVNDVISVAFGIFNNAQHFVKFGIDSARNIENAINVMRNIHDDVQDSHVGHIIDDVEDEVSHGFKFPFGI